MAERLPFPRGSSEESALTCGPHLSTKQPKTSYLPGTSAGQRSAGLGSAAKGQGRAGSEKEARNDNERGMGEDRAHLKKGRDGKGAENLLWCSGFHASKSKRLRSTG